jgi:predicted transcriptional regulator
MKQPKKQQLSIYLEPAIQKQLADYAARRDHSLSLVAEAAIASFLSPDAAERQEAATTKRLDQIDRRMARLERAGGRARASRRTLRRLRSCTRPQARQGAEALAGDFGRH